ncbi:TetR/AcrR family transcriptional regulator [Nocardia sp. NPDC050406]|uniref:TetR/AcrR family transcriptional regulator n=1 Tax=Nocardia sp. NPDC050406 TaxID=3364318 RepID=UPI0037AC7E58
MPKALAREELQARTRADVLAAAQEVFLSNGFHATSIAQIAAAAGRTHGAIYGHFPSKEALCQEVLRLHYEQWLADVTAAVLAVTDIAAKLAVVDGKWRALNTETAWATLAVEFVFASRQDPVRAASITETATALQAGVRLLLISQAAGTDIDVDPDVVDRAAVSLVALGLGLVIAGVLGTVDADSSAATAMENTRMWLARCGVPEDQLVG